MEAEKAKENEEFMSKTFNDLQKRVEELTVDCSRQRKLTDELQDNLALKEEQNETFQKVVDKFYQIRQDSFEKFVDVGWDEKCARLLHDLAEMWSFNDASTAKYISSLEEELERARKSVDNFQNKLRMGLEIENHLKMKVRELEKKNILANAMIKDGIAELWHYHSQCRVHITSLLDDGRSHIKSVVDLIDEKIRQPDVNNTQNLEDTAIKRRDRKFLYSRLNSNANCGLILRSHRFNRVLLKSISQGPLKHQIIFWLTKDSLNFNCRATFWVKRWIASSMQLTSCNTLKHYISKIYKSNDKSVIFKNSVNLSLLKLLLLRLTRLGLLFSFLRVIIQSGVNGCTRSSTILMVMLNGTKSVLLPKDSLNVKGLTIQKILF
ncbi:hypothetical protein UlMin_008831 [Ulmus minor]